MTAPRPPGLVSAPNVGHWFSVKGDGLLVRTGRAELGQGNATALLQMAAHRLDLAPGRIEIAGPDTGASPDEGFTAGSLSISQGGAAIRAAASALRAIVLSEAARRLNAAAGGLTIREGEVLRDGDATGLTVWALAASVDLDRPIAELAAPEAAPDRSPDSAPGTAMQGRADFARIDLRDRLVGAPFLHDMAPEGLLHGRTFPPPTLDSTLAAEPDLEALAARPGVVEVVRDGRFIGLVAETDAAAGAAARWFEPRLDWTDGRDVPSDPLALLQGSEAEAERLRDAPLPGGEPDADLEVTRPFLSHGSIGPSVALARLEAGRLTVWSHTQGVYPLRAAIAGALGLEAETVRVIHAPGAGCYGHNGADDAALDAALLARACPGRPVRVMWSRAQEFRIAPMGAPMRTRVRVWMAEGRVGAVRTSVVSPPHSTRPGTMGAPCLRSAHLLEAPVPMPVPADLPEARGGGAARNGLPLYAAPALLERTLVTGLPWRTSSLRALGAHLNVYGIETAVEAAILARSLDSFDARLASLDDGRARDVLTRLREISADILGTQTETRAWGIALARYKNAAAWAAVLAEVSLGDTVTVPQVRVAVDMGEVVNRDGARNQIEGGVIQALSWTLKEAMTLDGPRVATAGWEDYPILRFSEVPRIEVALIDRPDDAPLGCAEAVQGPAAAAVGNAVQHLIGVPVRQLPITREAIIAAVSA